MGILGLLSWNLLGCLFFLTEGLGAPVDFWDYQLLAYVAFANLTSIFMFGLVAGTRSKYATLAGARVLLVGVFLEVFFTLGFWIVYCHGGGYGFEEVAAANALAPLALALPPLGACFFLFALFEAKRAPFDHPESESELVAGHQVELGGRLLLFFYLCEYVHVYFCMFIVLVLVSGAGAPPLALALSPGIAQPWFALV
jgi:NADH:ubiquinone oxidoreductase subunit H